MHPDLFSMCLCAFALGVNCFLVSDFWKINFLVATHTEAIQASYTHLSSTPALNSRVDGDRLKYVPAPNGVSLGPYFGKSRTHFFLKRWTSHGASGERQEENGRGFHKRINCKIYKQI